MEVGGIEPPSVSVPPKSLHAYLTIFVFARWLPSEQGYQLANRGFVLVNGAEVPPPTYPTKWRLFATRGRDREKRTT